MSTDVNLDALPTELDGYSATPSPAGSAGAAPVCVGTGAPFWSICAKPTILKCEEAEALSAGGD